MTNRTQLQSLAGALLRIVAGGLFAIHGAQKIFGVLGAKSQEVGSQLWIGGLIELVTGILVAIGLFTRPAALLASGTMAVAYFQYHWKLALDNYKWLPAVNQGEMAVLYCFIFFVYALSGAGSLSLDANRGRG